MIVPTLMVHIGTFQYLKVIEGNLTNPSNDDIKPTFRQLYITLLYQAIETIHL